MDFYENIVKTTSFPSVSSVLFLQYLNQYCNVFYHITALNELLHIPIAVLLLLDDVLFAMQPFHDYMIL